MKKMFTTSERINRNTGKPEQVIVFCQKAQRIVMEALAEAVLKSGQSESKRIADSGVSTSAIYSFKKADRDRSMLISVVEKLAQAAGFKNSDELLNKLDDSSRKPIIALPAIINHVDVENQKMFATGKGMTIIKDGKKQIVLRDLDALISKGENGETIVVLAEPR